MIAMMAGMAFATDPPPVAPHGFNMYEHPGYGGRFVYFVESQSVLDDGSDPANPWPNDAVSGIRMFGGAIVDVYNDVDFGSFSKQFDATDVFWTDQDDASSINLMGNSLHPHLVLYEDTNYGGKATTIVTSDPDLAQGIPVSGSDNTASSLRVFNGAIGWLCVDVNYFGSCVRVAEDIPDLSSVPGSTLDMNDKVSSVESLIPHIILWQDVDYGGLSHVISESSDVDGEMLERASSMAFYNVYDQEFTLYDGADMTGDSHTIETPTFGTGIQWPRNALTLAISDLGDTEDSDGNSIDIDDWIGSIQFVAP